MSTARQVTREELYEMVWTKPLSQLASEFGISDVAVGKMCRRMNVPLPGRGYWARIDAGAKLPRTPLPKRSLRQAEIVRATPPKPAESEADKIAREAHEALVARFANLRVPDHLEDPHKLTVRTRKHFEAIQRELAKPERKPRLGYPGSSYFTRPRADNGRYACAATEGFPLKASFATVSRALAVLDTLAKALEGEGFRLQVDAEKKVLEAVKDGEGISFHLREGYTKRAFSAAELKARREKASWASDHEWVGSGKLTLTVSGREWGTEKSWVDDKRLIESRLPDVLATFLEVVPKQKRLREERAKEAAKRQARERIEEERRWKEAEERREFEAVFAEAQQHDSVARFQKYLDSIERSVIESSGQFPEASALWFARMRRRAAAADPYPKRVLLLSE